MATTFLQKKNNAKSTITNNPLTAGGLSITLASSGGAKFPTTGATWLATIWDAVTYADPSDDPNMEVVLIDSRSTDTLTVNASGRGFAGTTGVSHATGSAIRLLIMKEHMAQYETAINTLEAASVLTYTPPTTWTPGIGYTGGTITAVINVARYWQIGKMHSLEFSVTASGSTGAPVIIKFTPNTVPADATSAHIAGGGYYLSGAGVPHPCTVRWDSTGGFWFEQDAQAAFNTPTGGTWSCLLSYEVA